METATSKASEEAQIRQLIDNWVSALRARDLDKMMSNYSPDILVFAATPPLEYTGAREYRRQWQGMFDSIQGPVGCEIRDLKITVGNDLAFGHCLNRLSGKMKDGKGNFPWIRLTLCFRKVGGTWMVTHEHASVPFDPENGKASLDLKP
jgi:ketosteroid isomerase-like protein